jgi:HEAT repeat protein
LLRPALLILAASALVPVLPAQHRIDYPKPRKQPPAEKPAELEATAKQEEAAEPVAPAVPGHWETEAAAGLDPRVVQVLREFEALETRGDEVRRAYLDRLRGFGLDGPRDAALHGLGSSDEPTVALCAELLEYVGEPDDAAPLVSTAAAIGSVPVATSCLEVALRLNGGWLPARALRLLDHPKRGVRAAAEARLGRLPHETYVAPLLQALRFGRDHDARLRAARLLRAFHGQPEVRRALLEALLDASVPVAFEVADTLAGEADEEARALLRQDLLATPPGLQQAYLWYALLHQQEILDQLLVDAELLAPLRDALREADLFLSGAAAACLAEYLFRSTDLDSLRELEVEILHGLVKAVGGLTFYPQYARFSELGEKSLSRITGEDFSHLERSAWLAWYTQSERGFRAVRGQLRVTDADLPRLSIAWQQADGEFRCLAGRDTGHATAAVRTLGELGMVRLLERIERAQLLDVRVLPGIYGSPTQDFRARVAIEVGLQRKPLTFRGESAAEWLPGLLRDLDEIYDGLSWQALAPPASPRAFVLDWLARWDATDAEERRLLELELTRLRAAELDAEVLSAWCATLEADPGLAALWDVELGRLFLALVPAHTSRPELARQLLDAALRRPDLSLAPDMIDGLADLAEPLRSELLQRGMLALGPGVSAEAMGDERLAVRVAAARSLGRAGEAGKSALLAALGDPDALVVQMAARSLGQLGDADVVPRLLPLTGRESSKGVRTEALWALGELGDPAALDAVSACCGLENEASVRMAAVQALGRLRGEEVDAAFGQLFPIFSDGELELSWARAAEGRGAAAARAILRPHLEAPDPVVAERAAVLAGRLGDPDAVGPLMRLLNSVPHDVELLGALVTSTGVDFRTTPDPAGVYAAWWSENGLLEPAYWLERAAANAGILLPEAFDLADQVPPARAAAELVGLLENGPEHLRPLASYFLHRVTGLDAPAVRPDSSYEAVRGAAQRWREWSAARAGG